MTDTEIIVIGGFVTRYLAAPEITGGAHALVEHTLAPGLLGAPPHRHSNEDECSYVLEGSLTIWREGQLATFGPGEVAIKPRGEFHAFWNAGAAPVRFLEVIAPGAFANYFRELAPLINSAVASNRAPDLSQIAALAARYGLEFDFSKMPTLLAEHGLKAG
jgi:quercetin dioxygenase-like cupin family protein